MRREKEESYGSCDSCRQGLPNMRACCKCYFWSESVISREGPRPGLEAQRRPLQGGDSPAEAEGSEELRQVGLGGLGRGPVGERSRARAVRRERRVWLVPRAERKEEKELRESR